MASNFHQEEDSSMNNADDLITLQSSDDQFAREEGENEGQKTEELAPCSENERELELKDQVRDNSDTALELENLQMENHFLETTNKMLMSTLTSTRAQLSFLFHECTKKTKEAQELTKELEKRRESASNSTCLTEMQEEAENHDSNLEAGKSITIKVLEETIWKLRREVESLQTQKEDIINHSKHSEQVFSEKLAQMKAKIDSLQAVQTSKNIKEEDKEEMDRSIELSELKKKLKNALEAIDDIENENGILRNKLDECIEMKIKLERDVETQKSFLEDEKQQYEDDCEKYEVQIANLNEDLGYFEEIRVSLASELKEANEKHIKMCIAFANDKANFCNDMERTEEKWNAEVVKLKEQTAALEKLVFNSAKEAMDRKEMINEEALSYQQKIEKLEEAALEMKKQYEDECDGLRDEISTLHCVLSEARNARDDIINNYDDECEGLEKEIYEEMKRKKTYQKKLQTLRRKYKWLISSIRALSLQRRNEIVKLKAEIQKLNDFCHYARVDAWNESISEREELQNKIQELEKENETLEEKIETVTEKWREECAEYEENVAKMQEKRRLDNEEFRGYLKAERVDKENLYKEIGELNSAQEKLMAMLQTTRDEAAEKEKQLREITEAEKTSIWEERTGYIRCLKAQVKEMKAIQAADQNKIQVAEERIKNLECEAKAVYAAFRLSQKSHSSELDALKTANQMLRENMGVEELEEDVTPDISSSSSSSTSSQYESETASEDDDADDDEDKDDRLYDDMPQLSDERVSEKNSGKNDPEEWEMVVEEM
uniref:Uncharacterized protein n=1 Tax=Caenorhabditis japonica TaxID=281687 RepID=A0A8R1DKN6_CAEJA